MRGLQMDQYKIEGYEILVRVPRAYPGHTSAVVYLPLEWTNARVKIVRIDPIQNEEETE
jgi:hypothetical protein